MEIITTPSGVANDKAHGFGRLSLRKGNTMKRHRHSETGAQ
jgi:hypothetical protein